ncbi:MAG: hypothetical protein QOK35_1834 [Pseudonocardiales bacterium]|jgi:hypothetical protein|nr:hypothetical protein [Pseudonocardiales bacterium]
MSAPTPPPYRREWLVPQPPPHHPPDDVPAPSALRVAFDIVARLGTAVTLAALLVVTGTLLAVLDAEPVPAGVSTAGR